MIIDLNKWVLRLGWVLVLVLGGASGIHAQSYVLKGTVVDRDSALAIPNCYVVNKASYIGTVTNGIGYFEIPVAKGDTLVISNVGYQFRYVPVDSALISKIRTEQRFELIPRNFLLDEVSIYAITSNNPKSMPMSEPRVPRTENIREPQTIAPTLANPLDLLYYSFGKRPRQLAALRELQREDYYRRKLEEGSNRRILEELTGIPREEMEAFMFYCKYSSTEIQTFNDYHFHVSLLSCCEEYEREQQRREALERMGGEKQ